MKRLIWVGVLVLLLGNRAYAAIHTERIDYKDEDVALEGYIAYDDKTPDIRPGILIVHEWTGLGPYAKRRAEQLAKLGYTAFAVDMYGKDVRPKNHEEAAKVSGIYRSDRQLMRKRIQAALAVFGLIPTVDAERIAAIGYCFGGTTVLELARSGAAILGVASFHGGLDTPNPADAKNIKARVIVFHGADDKFVTQEQVAAFESEMKAANADYKLIQYPGAVHSFTVPEAGNDPSTGMAYNQKADEASWKELEKFLREIFAQPRTMHATTEPSVGQQGT